MSVLSFWYDGNNCLV